MRWLTSLCLTRTEQLKPDLFWLAPWGTAPDTRESEALGADQERWERARKAIESCTDREKLPEIWAYALVIPFSREQFDSLYQYACGRGRELAVDPALLPPPTVQA